MGERERVHFHLVTHSPNAHNAWIRLKLRHENTSDVGMHRYVWVAGTGYLSHQLQPPGVCIARSFNWELETGIKTVQSDIDYGFLNQHLLEHISASIKH